MKIRKNDIVPGKKLMQASLTECIVVRRILPRIMLFFLPYILNCVSKGGNSQDKKHCYIKVKIEERKRNETKQGKKL